MVTELKSEDALSPVTREEFSAMQAQVEMWSKEEKENVLSRVQKSLKRLAKKKEAPKANKLRRHKKVINEKRAEENSKPEELKKKHPDVRVHTQPCRISTNNASKLDDAVEKEGQVTDKQRNDRGRKAPKRNSNEEYVDVSEEDVAACSSPTKGAKADSPLGPILGISLSPSPKQGDTTSESSEESSSQTETSESGSESSHSDEPADELEGIYKRRYKRVQRAVKIQEPKESNGGKKKRVPNILHTVKSRPLDLDMKEIMKTLGVAPPPPKGKRDEEEKREKNSDSDMSKE